MFNAVAGPVLFPAHAAAVVVSDHAGPHDIGPRLIIIRIRDYPGSLMDHGHQKAFDDTVCRLHFLRVCKIPFKQMGHDVRNAGRCLERRQRLSQLRIQDGKSGTESFAGGAPFQHAILQRDHRIRTSFTSGGSDGENRADGKGCFHRFPLIKVPEISIIYRTGGNGFGRIDGTSAAHSQYEIHVLFSAQFNTLIYQAASGIGADASQLHIADILLFQRSFYSVQKTGTHHAAPAVMDQNLAPSKPFHIFACMIFLSASKNKIGRTVECKIIHNIFFLSAIVFLLLLSYYLFFLYSIHIYGSFQTKHFMR